MTDSWRIAGGYFESCNCEAICPCRMVAGVPGGRSTNGVCFGALSWQVEEGHAGDVDLGGLDAALVYRYSDDEERSPWTFNVHVDERGDERQRAALGDILVGKIGGSLILALPWVRKPATLLEVKTSRIEVEIGPKLNELRIGSAVEMRASTPFETDDRVSCIVPGHHRAGTELVADHQRVADGPFEWELTGNCAFVTRFEYTSDEG